MKSTARTRKYGPDTSLESVRWTLIPFRDRRQSLVLNWHVITKYPTANGPTDSALVADGLVIAILKAKRLALGPNRTSTCSLRTNEVEVRQSFSAEVNR